MQVAGWLIASTVFAVVTYVLSRYLFLWLQARLTGTDITLIDLILMSLKDIDPRVIVKCQVMAVQSGLPAMPTRDLEALYLAGGNVQRVTLALIAASRSGIKLDWEMAAPIDLAGRDIMEAVLVSVNPKVISCPDPKDGRNGLLYAVAKDGIELKVRVKVTVRTNMLRLVGGATEATIVARVGQGIISAIGSCETYQDALCDPAVISRQVLAEGLDAQTAFAIVSIDIADIDVGNNIGALLRVEQANSDIRVARAAAEQQRAFAVAQQQEMKARAAGYRANLVRAEAGVPSSIAFALRAGHKQELAPMPRKKKRQDFFFDHQR